MRAIVITVSDRCSRGERADQSGPLVRELLERSGHQVSRSVVIPDEQPVIEAALRQCADAEGADCVLTTGGTGFGPRDVTPEATLAVVDRVVPGIPEMLRSRTAAANIRAWLSRGVAGLRGRSLIVNLPGHPRAVEECMAALLPLLPHAAEMISGNHHE